MFVLFLSVTDPCLFFKYVVSFDGLGISIFICYAAQIVSSLNKFYIHFVSTESVNALLSVKFCYSGYPIHFALYKKVCKKFKLKSKNNFTESIVTT